MPTRAPRVNRGIAFAKGYQRRSPFLGLRTTARGRWTTLPGNFDLIELKSDGHARLRWIEPGPRDYHRVWIRNTNTGTQHWTILPTGNLELPEFATIHPGEVAGAIWDGGRRLWMVDHLPVGVDGGSFKYTGAAGYAGLVLNDNGIPLIWDDGTPILWTSL